VSNGNYNCRAIGKVIGDYYYEETDDIDYCQFRDVEWLVKDVNIPVSEIYDRIFSQASIYKLDKSGIKTEFFVKSANEISNEDNSQPKNYVLIIDEINRGNVSQIFGELITLIEDDKREGCSEELSVRLPYSKESFSVPQNLYIIGTMNTADRSVEALDTALRRRFSFIEMLPIENHESITNIEGIDLKEVLKLINLRIEKLLSRDHTIGHSFFLDIETTTRLYNAFYNKIIPLLQEYFFGDYGKIGLILGKGFFDPAVPETTFADFEYDDKDLLMEKKVYRMKSFKDEDSEIIEDEFLVAVREIIA
jgi:5-methylcytosine-specific restriction endonuclease McrBC GTP-binding regulatory subunit McrB